jgi:hypothetical protein
MSIESQLCEWPQREQPPALFDVIEAIPDGIRLAYFPSHCEGVECWCRPQVDIFGGEVLVRHKNLADGEFDS